MAAPRVTVLMPVRDAARTVGRAINGVRAQTFGDWELLAVDDGSEDETPGILEAAAVTEPRVP